MLLELELESWSAVCPAATESAAYVALLEVAMAGNLAGNNDEAAVTDKYLSCLLLKMMSQPCALRRILAKSGSQLFGPMTECSPAPLSSLRLLIFLLDIVFLFHYVYNLRQICTHLASA
jgi:hypothetical protein